MRNIRHKLELHGDITRHNIRNPIKMIMGNVELGMLPTSDANGRFDRIERAAQIISSHIQFAKDYQEVGTTEPRWQSLAGMIGGLDVIKGIDGLEISDKAGGLEVHADPMLEMVFHNLIENSAKYAGAPTLIRIDCEQADGGLMIAFEDNGRGVPDGEKERIFQKGYGKGTGLGLFLSREVLAMTGITVRENGVPGNGVRFEMLIPTGKFRFS